MPRTTLIVSGLAAAAAAVALLVITLSPGESEPFRASGPTLPAGVTIPTPNFQFATILPPRNGETQPTEIMIVAERIPYDPAAFHQYIQDSSPEWNWLLKYSEPYGGEYSAITLDHSGAILTQIIYPWHANIFQPFLDYAGVPLVLRETDIPWPTATPTATPAAPIVVTIAGKKLTLPPEMKYSEVRTPPPGTDPAAFSPYRDMSYQTGSTYSGLRIDDAGRITHARILPEHLEFFQPLLDAALPQLQETVTIYGQTITLAPGMQFFESTAVGTDTQTWTVTYMSIPAKPTVSFIVVEAQTGNVYRSNINPGDEPLFQPLLDLAASVGQ